ncbi:MAG: hypothetical protein A2Z89_01720 [Deltaproteobacteria bacterium GWA2_43_19]|nr:MAG: hypothetical protein A2Z89_01720 [Deltaproteobacteria bacterium GWA2_43_19]
MFSQGMKTLIWKTYLLKDVVFKKRVYAELQNITKSLEDDIFPKLQAREAIEASVEIMESGLKVSPLELLISASQEVSYFFRELGISKIEMDVILESNQIMDILKDVYAMKTISPLLLDGYKAHCAITRFTPATGDLSIKYNYCELDYSKAVRDIKEKSKIKDHRIFFQKAPQYGMLSCLLVIMLGLIYPYLPRQLSIALSIMIGVGTGILVFLGLQILGSLEYDKEYLEKRLKASRPILQDNESELTGEKK